MTILGETRLDLPFEICSKFKPTVLQGHLCYSLDFNLLDKPSTKPGIENGILLILDPGQKGNDPKITIDDEDGKRIVSLNLKAVSPKDNFAQINLNTLASFSDNKAGSYSMTALKKMTGTEGFMKLADDRKNCASRSFETCHTGRYIEEVQRQCGCVPWTLSGALTLEVGVWTYVWFYLCI